MARLARSPLGRETQTAALETLLASAMVGEGRAAFVVGEAGLGKTTMLEHASVMARGLGMRTLHGAAQELERQRPFAAISACLGVGEALADIFGARAAEVLRGDAQHTAPGVNLGLGGVDFAAVEMMLGLVDDLCAQGPLAVIIDDIQWADDASLQVLNGLVSAWSSPRADGLVELVEVRLASLALGQVLAGPTFGLGFEGAVQEG
ncbi:ATP-binding protein [Streptomyces lydicamycinicus]|uniref:ATP-binding protein n=1 Tax=Streptomyces lydicamycinicus TaxID=1546107 RepID=UPI003C2D1F74